jgi:hypothetical protein
LRRDDGRPVCPHCLGLPDMRGRRKRKLRETGLEGVETRDVEVVVCHCPADGHTPTSFPSDVVMGKHYGIGDIRSVLEGADCSFASDRTKSYWRSWFRGVWRTVVSRLCALASRVGEKGITDMLVSFLRGLGDGWLRYVLDLFHTVPHRLCMFVDVIPPMMTDKGGSSAITGTGKAPAAITEGRLPP